MGCENSDFPERRGVMKKIKQKAKRSIKKILLPFFGVALIAMGIFSMVFEDAMTTAYAQESFSGLEEVITSHTGDDAYVILEIVPDLSAAKIGYMVEGCEPYYVYTDSATNEQVLCVGMEETLAALSGDGYGASVRTSYINTTLVDALSTITGSDDALSYTTYTESYVSFTDATAVVLDNTETIAAGTSGYTMTAVTSGDGDYTYVDETTSQTGSAYYYYVGDGAGDYVLEASDTESLTYDVLAGVIYYTGGFSSNDLLKNAVFNASGDYDTQIEEMSIEVQTVLASDVTADMVSAADFIYLSSGSLYLTSISSTSSGVTGGVATALSASAAATTYSATNDLSEEAAYAIYAHAKIEGTDDDNNILLMEALMLDYSIFDLNNISDAANLYKLMQLLTATDTTLSALEITDSTSYSSANASSVTAISDSDHHYVNHSVYVVPGDSSGGSDDFELLTGLSDLIYDGTNDEEDTFTSAASAIGFGEIAEMIIDENFYRETENAGSTSAQYGYFDQTISKAIAFEYVISYSGKREEYTLDSINILDVGPEAYSGYNQYAGMSGSVNIYKLLGISVTANDIYNNMIANGTSSDDISSSYDYYIYTDSSGNEITLSVTHVSSPQFIGMVEDLNNYDLIYFGLDITSTGSVVDSNLTNLIYTNIGDLVSYVNTYNSGILDTDYTSAASRIWTKSSGTVAARYSGNDFTDEKVEAVKNAVKSGIPVILADGFLTEKIVSVDDAGNTTTETVVNDYDYSMAYTDGKYTRSGSGSITYNDLSSDYNGYIDNCSKVYELIDAIKDYSNVMTAGSLVSSDGKTTYTAQQNLLMRYIQMGKPELTVTESDVEPDTGEEYITANDGDVNFTFTVANYGSADANVSFNVYLYADYNADGRFSSTSTTEYISASNYSITLNGKTLSTTTDDDGKNCYQITKGGSGYVYTLTFNMGSYTGVLPIKLIVAQSGNTTRYDASDVYYFYNHTGTKQAIKVIQILPTWVSSSFFDICVTAEKDNTFYTKYSTTYGGDYDITKYTSSHLSLYGSNVTVEDIISEYNSSPFADAIDADGATGSSYSLADFDIQVDSVFADDYATVYAGDSSCLDDYDMLIMGFADCYEFLTMSSITSEASSESGITSIREAYANAYQGISDFVDSGRSVLLTHDLTSATSVTGQGTNGAYWSAYLNEYVAPDAGMNRYGVFDNLLLRAGISGITSGDTSTKYQVSNYASLQEYVSTYSGSSDSLTAAEQALLSDAADGYVTSDSLYNAIVASSTANSLDIAYIPNSDKTELAVNVQGYSKAALSGRTDSTTVDMVNEGQILVYPYNLLTEINSNNGKMTIAATHTQYYQLDLNADTDGDGESDITVWFTISGTNKDVRNGYYIYTRGNVTYSGVGHTNINTTDNIDEIMLYVNTIVTSYNSGTGLLNIQKETTSFKDPTITTDTSVVYAASDASIASDGTVSSGSTIDSLSGSDTEELTITIRDTNTTSTGTKTNTLSFYLVYDSESDAPSGATRMTIDGETVYAYQLYVYEDGDDAVITTDSSKSTSFALPDASSGEYTVKVPYSLLNIVSDSSSVTLKVVYDTSISVPKTITTTDENGAEITTTDYDVTTYQESADVTIQKVGLFDLN